MKRHLKSSHTNHRVKSNGLQKLNFRVKSTGRPASAKEWFESYNHKRNEEHWKYEDLTATVNEMKKREWQAQVYTSLAQRKRDSCLDWKEKEEREKKLTEKRARLRKLFSEDEKKYELEREERRTNSKASSLPPSLSHPEIELLRNRLDDLKRQNEEERKKLAEKLSYESWRKNNPDIKEMDSERFNRFVRDAWVDQKLWKEDERKEREEEQRRREMEENERRTKEEEEEKQREGERREQRLHWTTQLQEQIKKIKDQSEKESELMRRREALEEERKRLEDFVRKREEIKEERKRKNLEVFWARQYQLKLKKKAAAIQTELIEDELIVEDLLRGTARQDKIELRKEEGEWVMQVLKEQRNIEKIREKEYDLLFSEEAEKMWLKREMEWRREQDARDKLMDDVMRGLEEQVREKLSSAKRETEETEREKENLMFSIEENEKKLEGQEREEDAERRLINGPKDGGRNVALMDEREIAREERLKTRSIEEHQREIARLDREMKNLWEKSYIPPRYGRKKVAW